MKRDVRRVFEGRGLNREGTKGTKRGGSPRHPMSGQGALWLQGKKGANPGRLDTQTLRLHSGQALGIQPHNAARTGALGQRFRDWQIRPRGGFPQKSNFAKRTHLFEGYKFCKERVVNVLRK